MSLNETKWKKKICTCFSFYAHFFPLAGTKDMDYLLPVSA